MGICTNLFPGGKRRVLTMSYDDGVTQDRRLVEIFDRYGIKGTFNLNSSLIRDRQVWTSRGTEISKIELNEVPKLYKNHEVAVHSYTHPHLELLPREMVVREIYEDRKMLEELMGYPVRGMAYPFGTYSQSVIEVLEDLGIEYSRTVKSSELFKKPENLMEWHPTCHHNNKKLMELAKDFLEKEGKGDSTIFYVWGHSYEFDVNDNWQIIEDFCSYVSTDSETWYATNIEIVDYLKAVKQLKFAISGTSVYNPTALSIWISVNGEAMEIKSGETCKL